MTEEILQESLEAERDWRIRELEFCKKIPFLYTYASFRPHIPLFWKFCVPIIYSHWEGFWVSAMKLLVDYLNEKNISYRNAAYHILLLDNKRRFAYLQGNASLSQQKRFLDELFESQRVGITIDRGIISANSNLNYERLEKMLSNFEMTASPKLQEQKPIIEKLVWYRNSIAHGENSIAVEQKDIESFILGISNSIDEIIMLISGYVRNSCYFK